MPKRIVKVAVIPGKDFDLRYYNLSSVKDAMGLGSVQVIVYIDGKRSEIESGEIEEMFKNLVDFLTKENKINPLNLKYPSELKEI